MSIFRSRTVGIISYCNFVRTYANVNHQYYADKNGYVYIYDIAPTHHDVFKNKIEKILKYLTLFDWVFWVDDDAFFLQYDQPLDKFLKGNTSADLIFCASPVNQGNKTYLSSGNFFLKNTPRVIAFLKACLETDLETAKSHWADEYGLFTNGDQDIIVYLLKNDPRFMSQRFHVILPYDSFNTRPFHFKEGADEHFLVHFTGNYKQKQAVEFSVKYNLCPALISQEDFDSYFGIYPITGESDLPATHLL